MGGDWFKQEGRDLGEVLDDIERLGFSNRLQVVTLLRQLANGEEPALALRAVHAIAKSADKAELAARLRRLIEGSIEDFSGSGSPQLLGLWADADQYDIEERVPTDPGMARFVEDAMDLFSKLHSLHDKSTIAAVSALEEGLVLLIQSYAAVATSRRTSELTRVAPELSLQTKVLEFLLAFEQDSAKGVHRDNGDPVRQRVQRCFIALCAEYDEGLVLGLRKRWQRTYASDLVERSLVRRFGRTRVIDGFLANRQRQTRSTR